MLLLPDVVTNYARENTPVTLNAKRFPPSCQRLFTPAKAPSVGRLEVPRPLPYPACAAMSHTAGLRPASLILMQFAVRHRPTNRPISHNIPGRSTIVYRNFRATPSLDRGHERAPLRTERTSRQKQLLEFSVYWPWTFRCW